MFNHVKIHAIYALFKNNKTVYNPDFLLGWVILKKLRDFTNPIIDIVFINDQNETSKSPINPSSWKNFKKIISATKDIFKITSNFVQDLVTERTRQLYEEKQKTEDLLHRMLPPTVALKLTQE